MTSILKVDTIQSSGGTTGLTINSGGDVTVSEMSCDQWRLQSNFSTNGGIITDWARPDEAYKGYINGLTKSGGVFSFTKTGLYKVDCHFIAQGASSDGSMGVMLQVSTDSGSSYDDASYSYVGDADSGNNNGAAFMYLLNVTDISTFRVRFKALSLASGSYILGATTNTTTGIYFVKLAPAQ